MGILIHAFHLAICEVWVFDSSNSYYQSQGPKQLSGSVKEALGLLCYANWPISIT